MGVLCRWAFRVEPAQVPCPAAAAPVATPVVAATGFSAAGAATAESKRPDELATEASRQPEKAGGGDKGKSGFLHHLKEKLHHHKH
ncbi:hypothetical protein Emag_006738 [Eimeria magna]